MNRAISETDITHVQEAVKASPLQDFGIPHIVVDNIFPADLVELINENWPQYEEGFAAEVPGNHILQIFRRNYQGLSQQRLRFWQTFNEILWPYVVSAVAEAFAEPAVEVFGDLYYKHLTLDHPLTLMQADPSYAVHSIHTHFYHCPHWAFTMLLYVDPRDKLSQGTALHRLRSRGKADQSQSSYLLDDIEWRTDVAMDTQHWLDPKKPDRIYQDQVSEYKCNRLFVFLDGPLALHSVPADNPDHTPNPERAHDGGRNARRRILRSHVKIHHVPFYHKHSSLLPEPIEPVRYMRLMAPDAVLSAEDQLYREKVLRPFFKERVGAYARAVERMQEARSVDRRSSLLERTAKRFRSVQLNWQMVQRIP